MDNLSDMEQELTDACERSRSHNECVHLEVADPKTAVATLIDLYAAVEVDHCDLGGDEGIDVWAYDVDEPEGQMVWRLRLLPAAPADDESAADLVLVESMPEYLRASHEAAGNRGRYPHNGAQRRVMDRECASHIVDDDWTVVVRDATDRDVAEYERADDWEG